ncbi:hypothetical protein JL193_14205 [Polaribacter batillariae]|uniref:Uncharacterized protein n=1 Tax=Polaribacter batillariae TaxID=2808900 RepID=A0ABX7SV98_9FLAO|nr:hypothetical protein [Polaribacter batillariae]QTD37245.1 hypothetical protein JL193_14205 [Polaribacter batillariae]
MKHLLKYPYFKLLFTVIFALVFNNKLQANTLPVSSNLSSISFSTNNFNEEENDVLIDVIIFAEQQKEEEESFSNNFSGTLSSNIAYIQNNIHFYKCIDGHLFSSAKKRFYILYCQLKTHF